MLRGAYWYSFNDEPIPTVSAYPYPRLTAPSFLLPDESPDSLWHLYAETVFGIEHFSSTSGLEWKRESIIAYAAHTPSIYREGSVYYLLYETERTKRKLRRVPSSIILRSSTDLVSWSDPITILDSEGIPYASYRDGRDRLSYPCLMQCDGRYRLYAGVKAIRWLQAYTGRVAISSFL